MNIAGILLTLLSLSWIIFQDFRTRSISWWLLPLVATGFFLQGMASVPAGELGRNFLVNIFFVALQLALVWTWMKLRKGDPAFINGQIGLGDLLFFLCIALFFSPGNFILFYCGSLLLVVLAAGVFLLVNHNRKMLIPLAGAQAIPLLVICGFRLFHPSVNTHDDEWIFRMINLQP
jgi:hypothetical protein